jgi:homoserine kinase type II
MPTIRLHPDKNDHALAFDLREILAAVGADGLSAYWSIGDVASQGEKLDANGDGAVVLEELAISGERIIGSRLAEIAESVRQVIWGEFKGYQDQLSETPRVVVIAFDSSWWEVQSVEAPLLNRVSKAFQGHVEQMDLVYILHHVRADDEYAADTKLIGVYRSRDSAEAAILRLQNQPGFRDHPAGFNIDPYQLDKDHWAEGFIKASEA